MRKKVFFKPLTVYLVFAVFLLTLPSQGWAMFVPSAAPSSIRQADINTIQKTLETAVIKQRIMDYGLTPGEALDRINKLSDGQIHEFAANLESLQAGADGVDGLVFLVLVAILVVLILQATGHKIIIR